MLTSMAASSGSSSLRVTSMGPLTAARTVKRLDGKVADPSARERGWVVSSGPMFGCFKDGTCLAGSFYVSHENMWVEVE